MWSSVELSVRVEKDMAEINSVDLVHVLHELSGQMVSQATPSNHASSIHQNY